MFEAFDILKKLPDGGIVWIEAAESIESARERIKLFANLKPAEYVIFCHQTQSTIVVPWVPFSRSGVESLDKTETKKPESADKKTESAPKSPRIIAKIVAEITRTFRH